MRSRDRSCLGAADFRVTPLAPPPPPPSPAPNPQYRIQRAMDISSKHTPLPKDQWEDPWREYEVVEKVLAQTQKEHDERKAVSGRWWMPYHIGRESWFPYDTKNAWFWKR